MEDSTDVQSDAGSVKPTRNYIKDSELTSEMITNILKDIYHNKTKVKDASDKHNVSTGTVTRVKKNYGEAFQAKFGKQAPKMISVDEVKKFWDEN